MAKSKRDNKTTKKVLEEETISQPTDAEVDIDLSESELETAADDAGAEPEPEEEADAETEAEDEAEAEADGDDAADDDGGEEAAADEAPRKPRPKLTWLTIALIMLNWIAAPAFLYVAYLDYNVHMQYSYRTFLNYAQDLGLPLSNEEDLPSPYSGMRPALRLTGPQLSEAMKKRGAGSTAKEVAPVEEAIPILLRPTDMTDELLADLYGSSVPQAQRFKTLDEAMKFVQEKLPADIADAANQVKETFAKKKEDEKQAFVRKSIFIMTWDSAEANKMEDQIKAASGKELDDLVNRALVEKILYPIALDYSDLKDGRRVWVIDRIQEDVANAKGAELQALVDDAVQRRIYYDILAPLNHFRPGNVKVIDFERIADRSKFKLDQVKELLAKRVKEAMESKISADQFVGKDYYANAIDRDNLEKRQYSAFILFTLAHVQVPILDKKLYAKGIEQAQTVSGLYEFTNASVAYVQALRSLERRMEERVAIERDGYIHASKQDKSVMTRTNGFIDEQPAQIDRTVRLVEQIDAAQKRLVEKKAQRDHFRKIYDQRLAQKQGTHG